MKIKDPVSNDLPLHAVIDEHRDGRGDVWIDWYTSADEATSAAENDWNHLTSNEKAKRRICVCLVEEWEDLADCPSLGCSKIEHTCEG